MTKKTRAGRRRGMLLTKAKLKHFMGRVGVIVATTIKARTFEQGKGLDDRPHKRHSQLSNKKSFGAYSYTWGRVRAGLAKHPGSKTIRGIRDTSKVTLQYTGALHRQIQKLSHTSASATVGISGNAGNYAGHVHKLRPFLGVSKKDWESIEAQVHDLFALMVKQHEAKKRAARVAYHKAKDS